MADRQSIDIHNYAGTYARVEAYVQEASISPRNRSLILGFRTACLLKGVCGKVRLIRVMGALLLFARISNKDFDTFTKADVESLVGALLARQPAYSPETLGTYRAILRSFLTWVVQPDAFPTKQPPALVAWLNSAVKATHKRRLERNELLTPDEIALLIHKSPAARDRALLSVLWETGGRIAEIGNRTIQQVNKHQFGYTLDITGKTGQRSPLVISSAPYLTAWLATHPFPAPHHPLWVRTGNVTTPCALGYAGFMSIVHRALKRAGLTKRVYPHLFRHSRATYCVANGLMNEQQAKAYFGWAPSSRMLAIYAHLTIQDANNAILRENNLAPTQGTTDILQPQHCPACQRPNPHNTAYCTQCNTVLNEQRVRDRLAQQEASNAVILQLCKVLVDKGLLDEAADQLHAANLGAALQALMK